MNLTQFGNAFAFDLAARPSARRRRDGKLPYRLAAPLIAALSLGLWIALWKLAAFALAALLAG